MDNYSIADNFALLSKLMDIHGDNSFKAKSYAAAAFTIEKLPMQLSELSIDKISAIRGIGNSIAKNVAEQLETGTLSLLQEYLQKTPEGILTMLQIKGLGPKKIATIWKELEIETIGELLYACNENRLLLYKGFGEKSQQNIREAIEFFMGNQGSYLYQQVEAMVLQTDEKLKSHFPNDRFSLAGSFARQMEIISEITWVTTTPIQLLEDFFTLAQIHIQTKSDNHICIDGPSKLPFHFYTSEENLFQTTLFKQNGSESFLEEWNQVTQWDDKAFYPDESSIFSTYQMAYIPACRRENKSIVHVAKSGVLHEPIGFSDIRGIIHSHSNWSDGAETIEAMARAAKASGLEYLVISDHSQSAFYANGLKEDRILAQHQQIDELNQKLAPFRIFKSIESDILGNGSLDYEDEMLGQFDLVIASVHSNLKMTEEKAMMRLIAAIENPFTSILGHMTGRLLLSRNGYPVDHHKIIDACLANDVAIELNAHPRRLDIDWRWIEVALDKGVLISINPDAHSIEGFADCRYGILAAQKAGLTKAQNLSSFDLTSFERFLIEQHQKRN